jgi:tripartite-type tricarboxylate transporter receptor subunit TctC
MASAEICNDKKERDMKHRAGILLTCIGLAAFFTHTSAEEAYPRGPVRVVVGFAPGGGVDLLARGLTRKLQERFGQPFIVDNRPGAGSTIGAALVAKAKPDGQTLLFNSIAQSINQSLYPSLPFDTVKDFVAVSPVATAPNAISANPSAPFKTLGEMVDYAKKNPDKVSFGAIGGSTTMYLGMAMLASQTGARLNYVPYNGTVPSVMAAVSGEVQVVSSGYGNQEALVRDGRLRLLAMTTARPTKLAPGVPTVAEAAGLPGFEIVNWMGVFAPAGTPPAIVATLNEAIGKALADPELLQMMEVQKVEPYHSSAADFQKVVANDVLRFEKIVRETKAQPQ